MGEIQIPKVILDAMQEQLALLQKAVDRLTKQNQQKDERIGELEQALLNMQRARFGQQSEKRKYVLDDGTEQISMFDDNVNHLGGRFFASLRMTTKRSLSS